MLNKVKSIFDKAKYLLAITILQIKFINKFIDSADEHTNMNQSEINLTNLETEQKSENRLITLN